MFSQLTSQAPALLQARACAEYREMPGLKLTPAQAGRLWGLDPKSCDALLKDLVSAGFLAPTRDGAFVQSDRSLVR